MRYRTIFVTLVILVAGSAVAQTPRRGFERGTFEDLKGRTKVFVSSSPRDRSRARKVSRTIQDKLPGLTLVDSLDEAEIWLRFYSWSKYETTRTSPDLNVVPRLLENGQMTGGDGQTRFTTEQGFALRGTVVIIRRPGSPKLVMEFSKSGGARTTMADEFANEFIRAYRKATASL